MHTRQMKKNDKDRSEFVERNKNVKDKVTVVLYCKKFQLLFCSSFGSMFGAFPYSLSNSINTR